MLQENGPLRFHSSASRGREPPEGRPAAPFGGPRGDSLARRWPGNQLPRKGDCPTGTVSAGRWGRPGAVLWWRAGGGRPGEASPPNAPRRWRTGRRCKGLVPQLLRRSPGESATSARGRTQPAAPAHGWVGRRHVPEQVDSQMTGAWSVRSCALRVRHRVAHILRSMCPKQIGGSALRAEVGWTEARKILLGSLLAARFCHRTGRLVLPYRGDAIAAESGTDTPVALRCSTGTATDARSHDSRDRLTALMKEGFHLGFVLYTGFTIPLSKHSP
jgi:hypothetical protein